MINSVKELLFPVRCFGCKALGLELCTNCRKYWNPHFYTQYKENLTIYSAIIYTPIAKSILLGAKENSYKLADQLIEDALLDCLKRLPSHILRNAILMPIPGSKRSIRKRGRDFLYEITKELGKSSGLEVITGMYINRNLLDQSGLSAIDRKRNIKGAFNFKGPDIKGEILLVDDLVTTGATLLEAKRALNALGISANRAITACMAQTLNI